MTKKLAKKWLKAVRLLRDYYEGEGNECNTCPLCTISIEERLGRESHNCICLWWEFEKKTCPEDAVNSRMNREPRWCKDSIKRLNRWERKLNKIIGDK